MDAESVILCTEDASDAVVVGHDVAGRGEGTVFAIESAAMVGIWEGAGGESDVVDAGAGSEMDASVGGRGGAMDVDRQARGKVATQDDVDVGLGAVAADDIAARSDDVVDS